MPTPWKEVPHTTTVLIPRAFSFSSRFDPRNLSGPPWCAHSPSRGSNPGPIMSSGADFSPMLYHSMAPAARAASCTRLTLGIVAMHLRPVLHAPPLDLSRTSTAVGEAPCAPPLPPAFVGILPI